MYLGIGKNIKLLCWIHRSKYTVNTAANFVRMAGQGVALG